MTSGPVAHGTLFLSNDWCIHLVCPRPREYTPLPNKAILHTPRFPY